MAKKQKDYGRTALRDAEVAFHDKVDEVLAELTERRARAAAVEQANAAANRRAAEQYVSDLGPQQRPTMELMTRLMGRIKPSEGFREVS